MKKRYLLLLLAVFTFMAAGAQADTLDPSGLWGLERTCVRDAFGSCTLPASAQGVPVYIVSTGIKLEHVDFGGRAQAFYGNPYDMSGMGTYLAGIVGGNLTGVAKDADLYSVQVFNAPGSGNASDILEGLSYILHNGQPGVILLGFAFDNYSLAINYMVENLKAAGFVVVAPAGDYDLNTCNISPASSPDVLTVGCSDRNDARCADTAWGSCLDVFAPGEHISSTWIEGSEDYETSTGTSGAAAHAAGIAAQYYVRGVDPDDVYQAIKDDAIQGALSAIGLNSPNLLVRQTSQKLPRPRCELDWNCDDVVNWHDVYESRGGLNSVKDRGFYADVYYQTVFGKLYPQWVDGGYYHEHFQCGIPGNLDWDGDGEIEMSDAYEGSPSAARLNNFYTQLYVWLYYNEYYSYYYPHSNCNDPCRGIGDDDNDGRCNDVDDDNSPNEASCSCNLGDGSGWGSLPTHIDDAVTNATQCESACKDYYGATNVVGTCWGTQGNNC